VADRRVCAWCQRHLSGPTDPTARTTHGICGPCMRVYLAELDAIERGKPPTPPVVTS
jgi:hypothetical protein